MRVVIVVSFRGVVLASGLGSGLDVVVSLLHGVVSWCHGAVHRIACPLCLFGGNNVPLLEKDVCCLLSVEKRKKVAIGMEQDADRQDVE